MSRKYEAFESYVFDGCVYWYATNIHLGPLKKSIDFGSSIYAHAQFHILMDGV